MISNNTSHSTASEPTGAGLLVLVGLGVGLLGYVAWQAIRERKRQRAQAHGPESEPKAPDPRTQQLSPPMDATRRSGLLARARAWAEAAPELSEFDLARALWRSSWPDVAYPHPPRDDDHPSVRRARAFIEIAVVSARTQTAGTSTQPATQPDEPNPAKGPEPSSPASTKPVSQSKVVTQGEAPRPSALTSAQASREPIRDAAWIPSTDDELEGLMATAEAQLQANPGIPCEVLAEHIWRAHWPNVPCPTPVHPEDHPSVRTAARFVGAVVHAAHQELAA